MLTSSAAVYTPSSLEEALQARAAHPDAMILAGGTDVMVYLEAGAIQPPAFLDLWGCPGLRGIEARPDGSLRIGALTTWTDLARSPLVPAVMRDCARTIGAAQIQNRGTVGGNIANASPAGDSLPLWLVTDAVFVLASPKEERRVPAHQFFLGYRKTALARDELLIAVEVPALAGNILHYRKVGTRLAQAISKVVMAGRLRIADGRVAEARIAFGSVAPVPCRCPSVEAALTGQPLDPGAADAVTIDIRPIDDVRSNAVWRRKVARNILYTWLNSVAANQS